MNRVLSVFFGHISPTVKLLIIRLFMFKSLTNKNKGFTLIELLVVIAIIGILSSVVLASLSTARQKSRDAKRISDVGQVQLALELYFDRSQTYPSTTPAICGGACASTAAAVLNGADAAIVGMAYTTQSFLPKAPVPAAGAGSATAYYYYGTDGTAAANNCTGNTCTSYSIGTSLERSDNTTLAADADVNVTSAAFFGAAGAGTEKGCGAAQTAVDYCYDIKP